MGMRCSRVGCGAYAVASFCFDGRAALVWLDLLDPDRGTGAGVLCARHADTLTPPRGWHLQDRRTPAPRLWDDRPPIASATRPRVSSPSVVRVAHQPREPLPFDETPPPATVPEHATDVDDLLVAHTPLLARAFAAARSIPEPLLGES